MKKRIAFISLLIFITLMIFGCEKTHEHTWKDATCTAPKTCTRCGVTDGTALGHNWKDATCTAPKTCVRCSATNGQALGHMFNEGKCTRCGDADPDYAPPQTYVSNLCYDIIETGAYKDSIGYTHIIHKVSAKKDCTVEGTLIATDAAGNVIGKSTDSIVLTKGQFNFFSYLIEGDLTNATSNYSAKEKSEYLVGDRKNVVELVQYNLSGNNLYLTFRLNGTELKYFSRFKILFYKNDKIVSSKDGYFSTYTDNLTGNGSTDVAEIWAYGINFDRIEYFFEP